MQAPHSSGWNDCLLKVKEQILQDHTTTKDNLREKVRNYALNYLAVTPEANGIDKDKLIGELADKIEDDLKDYSFFQQPLQPMHCSFNLSGVLKKVTKSDQIW